MGGQWWHIHRTNHYSGLHGKTVIKCQIRNYTLGPRNVITHPPPARLMINSCRSAGPEVPGAMGPRALGSKEEGSNGPRAQGSKGQRVHGPRGPRVRGKWPRVKGLGPPGSEGGSRVQEWRPLSEGWRPFGPRRLGGTAQRIEYIYIHRRHPGNSQTLGKLAATHAPPRVKVKPDRLQPKKPPHRESLVQSEYASMPVSVSFCTKGGGRG